LQQDVTKEALTKNEECVLAMINAADTRILAYGNPLIEIPDYILKSDVEWKCLGITKSGNPRHPLYVPYMAQLTPFSFTKQ
jgi:hypothetical protein